MEARHKSLPAPAPAPAPAPSTPIPVPTDPVQLCAERWNGDAGIVSMLGYHLYLHHSVRRVWIFELAVAGAGPRCAVIAAVPSTDPEFGNDGAVSRPDGSGWDYMNLIAELGDPAAVQAQAPANANASLLEAGTVSLP